MAEPAGSTARGTEISERSTELVLPDGPSIEASIGEEGIAVRETRAPAGARWSRRPLDDGSASRRVASEATEQTSRPVGDESRASTSSSLIERAIQRTQREEVGVNEAEGSTASGAGGRWRTHAPSARSSSAAARDDEAPEERDDVRADRSATRDATSAAGSSPRPPRTPATGAAASSTKTGSTTGPEASAVPRGLALPGDRGPRRAPAETPRPSFWRRIALGRLGRRGREHDEEETPARTASAPAPSRAEPAPVAVTAGASASLPARPRPRRESQPAPAEPALPAVEVIEKRVMEPLLQALVSVEAKLERSHAELTGRSDHIDQRLTQLWEIEEQLGALGEIQEALLQVGEQQRRLESAFLAQTRTLRWLVGAVFFSLVTAAFVVAALLR